MRLTKVLEPPSDPDEVTMASHRLARELNNRFGMSLYFEGQRRVGDAQVWEWRAAGGPDAVLRLANDSGLGFWYLELVLDGDMDAQALDRCIDEYLTSEDSQALLTRARRPGENDGVLAALALALRDKDPGEAVRLLSERLRGGQSPSLNDVLMAVMLLDDPSLLDALRDARQAVTDERAAAAIDYLIDSFTKRRPPSLPTLS